MDEPKIVMISILKKRFDALEKVAKAAKKAAYLMDPMYEDQANDVEALEKALAELEDGNERR